VHPVQAEPAGHVSMTALLTRYWPGWQLEQLLRPVPVETLPGGQGLHDVCPVRSWKRPAAQGALLQLPGHWLPDSHCVCEVAEDR
jgi:hypothetical protein